LPRGAWSRSRPVDPLGKSRIGSSDVLLHTIYHNDLCIIRYLHKSNRIQWKRVQLHLQNNEDITTSDTTTPSIEMQGPIMISRAQQLRRQVNSFLCSSTNDLENRWLPNDLVVIRNHGVNHGGHVGHQEGAKDPRKHAQQDGGPS
jgi:hypothetical protein